MRPMIVFQLVIALLAIAAGEEMPIDALIGKLADTEDIGFGYSAQFAGSQFLPRQDSSQWSTGVLGAPPPKNSDTMLMIVKMGAGAIPLLVKHLDDKRPTKIKPVSGMMWTAWNDEYDYNSRTSHKAPTGVNRDTFNEDHHPNEHQITVGDLCFVALGQIVNRSFSATRYQPSAGLIVSSPTYSKALLTVVRADYTAMTAKEHKKQLIDDFTLPDNEDRRNGAAMRLAFYYPDSLDDLVVRQLNVPTFDVYQASDFVRDVLYPEKSAEKRRQLLEAYLKQHGKAARDGVILQLFDDLDTQIADEEKRLSPPLDPKYDARNILVQLFGYKRNVIPKDQPHVASWAETELVGFVDSLGDVSRPRIIEAVYRVFSSADDNDYLVLACIRFLRGKGHDKELIAYCNRRIGQSEDEDAELRKALQMLTTPQPAQAEQAGAGQPATKPADKTPVKDQPSIPTPKDGPR